MRLKTIRERTREVEREASVLSLDDPRFDPATIRAAAGRIYKEAVGDGNAPDLDRLARLFGTAAATEVAGLLESPESALRARLPAEAHLGLATVEPLAAQSEGSAVVRVESRARVWVGPFGYVAARLATVVLAPLVFFSGTTLTLARSRNLVAFWVLAPSSPGHWQLSRVEAPSSARRFYLPGAAEDRREQSLRNAVVLDAARDDAPRELAIPVEVAEGLPFDAERAALDLSLLDSAFTTDVIETAVRDVIFRWEAASEGERRMLEAVAEADATRQLLSPPTHALRGATLKEVTVLRVRAVRVPPEITVRVELEAWFGPRERSPLAPDGRRRSHTHWWQLQRASGGPSPWRLVDAEVDPFAP